MKLKDMWVTDKRDYDITPSFVFKLLVSYNCGKWCVSMVGLIQQSIRDGYKL